MRWIPPSLVVLAALPAAAEPDATSQVARALNAVLAQQSEATAGWPWQVTEESPAPNTGGVVALSLVRSYARAPEPAIWVTLVQYAAQLRQWYAPRDRQPYKADIELLASLAAAGIDPDGRALADELFARVKARSPDGRAEYQRIAAGRTEIPEIIGYDVGLTIRAARALGETVYAGELADAAIEAGGLRLRNGDDSFEVTAVGALLDAVTPLGRPYDSALAGAVHALVRAQAGDGSWGTRNTQATAYAVLGLSRFAAAHPEAAPARAAAEMGRAWLLAHQLLSGAWAAYHDGLPEPFVGPVIPLAEAEALAAVLALP